MPEPQVSFVITCHNYGRYLAECIHSIYRQRLDSFEIIVVNDRSTDDTSAVARSFTDGRVRLIEHETNLGTAQAITTGMRAARGRYVAHLDADDRYRDNYCAEMLPLLEAHPDAGFVYGDAAAMDINGRVFEDPWSGIRSRERHQAQDAFGDEFLFQLEEHVIPSPTVIGRRDVWLEALPFPAWLTDFTYWDWCIHLRVAREHPVYYRARTVSDYRVHTQNLSRRKPTDRRAEATIVGLLDESFAGSDRTSQKAGVRRLFYARAYLTAAQRYFGADMNEDARRCYLKALRYRPDFVFNPALVRQLAATFNRPTYSWVKRVIKRAA